MIDTLILNNVIDINPRNHEGTTPLHLAVMNGQIEVWKFMAIIVDEKIQKAALIQKNNEGKTPLHRAAHLE